VNDSSELLKGNRGVYKLQVKAIKKAEELEDYLAYAKQLNDQQKSQLAAAIVKALESSAEIEDNRALYY
jgi:peptidyl-prolyl cis-trans isomerase D